MRRIYITLFVVVAAAAAATTGLSLAWMHVQLRREWNPMAHERFRNYLALQVARDHSPGRAFLDEAGAEHGLLIRVEGPGILHLTAPDFFASSAFTDLQLRPVPPRSRWRPPQTSTEPKTASPEREGPTPPPDEPPRPKVLGLFDTADVIQGIVIQRGDLEWVFVRRPPTWLEQLAPWLLVGCVALVFIGLGWVVKWTFINPLIRLEKAIHDFAENIDAPGQPPPSGELGRLFHTFEDMKQQVAATMADRERLLRDVSHDLRSPITRMRMAVELMEDSPNRHRLLTDLADLSALVAKILEGQRGRTFRNEVVTASRAVETYLSTCPPTMPTRVRVAHDFAFAGNTGQLNRVFANLADNSEKYADRAWGLDIDVDRAENGHGLIRFTDAGGGVPAELADKLFEPFYKLDNARRQDGLQTGFGLGMHICRQIVESMGGEISAHTTPERGLAVEIRFPCLPAPPASTPAPSHAGLAAASSANRRSTVSGSSQP